MTQADEQEKLDRWLAANVFELEIELLAELPEDFPYDFDRASLAALEQVILGEFETRDDLSDPEERGFRDRLARYIGETVVRCYPGSRWIPGGPNYKDLPVVEVPNGSGLPVSPFELITLAVLRRTGTELTHMYDGIARIMVRHGITPPPGSVA